MLPPPKVRLFNTVSRLVALISLSLLRLGGNQSQDRVQCSFLGAKQSAQGTVEVAGKRCDETQVVQQTASVREAVDSPVLSGRWPLSRLWGAQAVLAVAEGFAEIYRNAGVANVLAVPNGVSRLPEIRRTACDSARSAAWRGTRDFI